MKNITIAGTVGRDAETRQAGQSNVTGWSVAVDHRGKGGEKSTVWFDVALWGKRGDALAQYIRKGDKITVCGELSTREHNGVTYLQVNADNLALQGGNGVGSQGCAPAGGNYKTPNSDLDDGDSIPF